MALEKLKAEEPQDVRDYAAVRGISRQEAAAELGVDDGDEADEAPGIGHNSGGDAPAENLTQAAREKLKQVIGKIEKLEEEKKEIAEQIRDVYAEAKAMGYDTKALRNVVRARRQDRQEREEQQAIFETYMHAIGELDFYD